jgi:hypothetical protein
MSFIRLDYSGYNFPTRVETLSLVFVIARLGRTLRVNASSPIYYEFF